LPHRLGKGAYKESEEVAFPKESDVDANFVADAAPAVQWLLSRHRHARPADDRGDHSPRSGEADIKDDFDFRCCTECAPTLQRRLVKDGYRVRISSLSAATGFLIL